MVQAFTGEHHQKVDKKGRMSIPAEYRRLLQLGDPQCQPDGNPRLRVIYGQHLKQHVQVYSITEFQRIVDEIYAMPREKSADQKRLSHLMITQSSEFEVDKDGRIILPVKLRAKLEIEEGDVYFRGLVSYFEMWNNDIFESTVNADIDDWLGEMGDDFDPMSMLGG